MSKEHEPVDCCAKTDLLVEKTNVTNLSELKKSAFKVSGMDCADEIAAIQKQLIHPKISKISANLMTSIVSVEHSPDITAVELTRLINRAGVRVIDSQHQSSFLADNRRRIYFVLISGFMVGLGLILEWFFSPAESIKFSIYLIATLFGGSLVFPKAIRSIKTFSLDMNVLMTIAVIGAFLIKEYSEGAAVVFLFSLAEMLEAFSVAKARRAIQEVLSITPQTANLILDTGTQSQSVELIEVGQKILIRPGDRIPLDGKIFAGSSYVNQAPLTGESQPVSKSVGDSVFAGTVNENGSLSVSVTHVFSDTKISHVIRLVEEAQSQKAPSQLFVDRFAKIYTPLVTVIAILVLVMPPIFLAGTWDVWFYRALVFLVIACPCALVIATPVSVVSALTALAKNGVLVKGGVFLESLGKLKAIAVDKTGTITEGRPQVASELSLRSETAEEFYLAAISLESLSTHPLAKAVVNYYTERGIKMIQPKEYKVIPGKGVEAIINDHHYFAGNHKLAHELGVCSLEIEEYLKKLESQAQSVVIVGHKPHAGCIGEVLGILGLADQPRAGVVDSIKKLHEVGINEVIMLSGDNQRTVDAISKKVGIDMALGDLLPEEKVVQIKKLINKHHFVGMIGDGINDAPALAQATVGIAMGAAGTDAAIETADIALMRDDLSQLSVAVAHGRKTLNIIRFNIGFALLTKAMFLGLGIFGYSSLWLAVAADMGASLLVIGNSMRLLSLKKEVNSK